MRTFDPLLLHFTSLWLSATNCFWQFEDGQFSLRREGFSSFWYTDISKVFLLIFILSAVLSPIMLNPQGVGPLLLLTRLKIQGPVPAERQKQIIRIFKWAGLKTIN